MAGRDEPSRWVSLVKRLTEASVEELGAVAKVFDVPKLLRDTKPEAYSPQNFSIGPYHNQRPELKDMERFKLAATKLVQEQFAGGLKFKDLVDKFAGEERKIRALYHRYLEVPDETLGLMMAIDTCFLLDFLERYHDMKEATDMVYHKIRDAMMLENQIPLFLFATSLQLRGDSKEVADKAMCAVLDRFIREVCPIKTSVDALDGDVLNKNEHLLELLYSYLVPASVFGTATGDGAEPPPPVSEEISLSMAAFQQQVGKDENVKKMCMDMSKLNIAPVQFIKKNLTSLSSTLEQIVNKVPGLSSLMPFLERLMGCTGVEAGLNNVHMGGITESPLVQEIMIPSVEQLVSCGVRLVPTPKGIAGIGFDPATATLSLPIICLDGNTEVILRNLVAYETYAVRGQLAMARYTELMNGIIDTDKDVKILQERGIIFNGMKSNKEAADMWNGMCRAVRPSKVPLMDDVIKAVNTYRNSRASVKARKLIKKYVFRSWKVLTLLATLVLLIMTAMQTLCTAYDCKHWFGGIMPQLPQLPAPAGGAQ